MHGIDVSRLKRTQLTPPQSKLVQASATVPILTSVRLHESLAPRDRKRHPIRTDRQNKGTLSDNLHRAAQISEPSPTPQTPRAPLTKLPTKTPLSPPEDSAPNQNDQSRTQTRNPPAQQLQPAGRNSRVQIKTTRKKGGSPNSHPGSALRHHHARPAGHGQLTSGTTGTGKPPGLSENRHHKKRPERRNGVRSLWLARSLSDPPRAHPADAQSRPVPGVACCLYPAGDGEIARCWLRRNKRPTTTATTAKEAKSEAADEPEPVKKAADCPVPSHAHAVVSPRSGHKETSTNGSRCLGIVVSASWYLDFLGV